MASAHRDYRLPKKKPKKPTNKSSSYNIHSFNAFVSTTPHFDKGRKR